MRRGARLVAAVAILLGSFAVVVPAEAARYPCRTGYLCLFRGVNFRGDIVKLKGTGYSEKVYYFLNDKATSVKNKTGRRVVLWADFESGDKICVEPGQKITRLSETTPDMNNTISSSTILDVGEACPD